ncbi:MAG TPA: flavodoxin family protein, partial [Rhodoglobus sp.]|nr:flavodoxin family protein [Rhodoglobus sp.]
MDQPARYDDLKAVYINCTLKRSPEISNTQGLMDRSIALMRSHGVGV